MRPWTCFAISDVAWTRRTAGAAQKTVRVSNGGRGFQVDGAVGGFQIKLIVLQASEYNAQAAKTQSPAMPAPSTIGLGELPTCGLRVVESQHGPGRFQQPKDACPKFLLVVAGHGRWECARRRYPVGPNTFCHVPAGQAVSQESLPNESILTYVLYYRPELLSASVNSQLSALGMVPLDLENAVGNQRKVVRSTFQEMLFEQDAAQPGWETILQSRLMDLAVRTLRLARGRDRRDLPAFEPGNESVERVARYAQQVKSKFFRHETIDEASRSVGLSRRQFTELFRKVTGQSWRQYVLGLRLKHAAELLTESDKSVSAVAFECGFEDLSNFHHNFRSAYGCSPMSYRDQRRVRISRTVERSGTATAPAAGFRFRGMKGWFWTAEQYLEEIRVLAELKMNFLMDCYGSMIMSRPGAPLCNEWWKPMSEERKSAYAAIIARCREHEITFCFALNPQVASPRLLDPGSAADLEAFYQHYAWAQNQGAKWFSVCFDVSGWDSGGQAGCGAAHATLVNRVLGRLRKKDPAAQFLFCPTACWGDGTNLEHRLYLETLARQMDPEVYVFWNGDSVVTPRITRVAADSYKNIVKHRLFLWDNYPVNDGNPTLHLGPLRGRDPGLCDVVDGYISNPMGPQNQINRIPLATCADYAYNPGLYNPSRSIGQAILRMAKTPGQQQVLKDLVDAYPGFLVAGGGTGTNPVRGKFGSLLSEDGHQTSARQLVAQTRDLLSRLNEHFPTRFPATKKTVLEDITWMESHLARAPD